MRGEPGLGKSALLAAAGETARAAGVAVLTAACVAARKPRSRSPGCTICCSRCCDRADELPGGQREALESAFGLAGEVTPDPLPIALATLTLVGA